jgi:hypothetical protein
MGVRGVLVGTAQGQWQWLPVGPHRPPEPRSATETLYGELWAAGLCFCLIPLTLALRAIRRTWVSVGSVVLPWALCVTGLVIGLQEMDGYYLGPAVVADLIIAMATLALCATLIVFIILALRKRLFAQQLSPAAWGAVVATTVLGTGGFILPYALWLTGGIARYGLATAFALLLMGMIVFAGDQFVRHILKSPAQVSGST